MIDLKSFITDPSIISPELFEGETISPEWLPRLQRLFTDDNQATQYYECYLLNIERQHSQMLALTMLYQMYALSQREEKNPFQCIGPVTFIIYDNFQRPRDPESQAWTVYRHMLRFTFNAPYFKKLDPSLRASTVSFSKDPRFVVKKANCTGDIIGQNVAGGAVFLDDVISGYGRLDFFEFPTLHQGLRRRIQSRFMSENKRFPGCLFIAAPPNLSDYETYETRIKDIQTSDTEPNTIIVLDDVQEEPSENNERTQEKLN